MSDDLLLEAIDQANAGLAPPPFGSLGVEILGSPASVQSSKVVRDKYLSRIKEKLSCYRYVLTGSLNLEIVWLVSAKSRHETDAKADIDNCLKPIIDAFTGPDGLFINDCQLQGLYICWRPSDSLSERLLFEFRFDADQWCGKERLAFLVLDRALCCPVDMAWPKVVREEWVSAMRAGKSYKTKLEELGVPYLAVAGMLGGSQPFHRTRTAGFPVLSAETFISGVE